MSLESCQTDRGLTVPLDSLRRTGNRIESLTSLAFVGQDEVVEANFVPICVAHALKQLFHQPMEMLLSHGIVIVLSVAPRLDQPGHSQQGEMVADSRLALPQLFTQRSHVQLLLTCQIEQDPQSRLVREQLENLHKILLKLVGEFRERRGGNFRRRFYYVRNHIVLSVFILRSELTLFVSTIRFWCLGGQLRQSFQYKPCRMRVTRTSQHTYIVRAVLYPIREYDDRFKFSHEMRRDRRGSRSDQA